MDEEREGLLSPAKSYGANNNQIQGVHKGKKKLAYMCFFVIGIGMLLPWNFFINADQYFKEKLSNNSEDKKLFESAFSICSQIPCGIALVLNLYLTGRVSRNARVFSTLIVSTLFFLLTTALVNVNTNSWTQIFFGITLFSIVVINFCIGIFQGTIFGIAGAMGARYVQGAVVGMSMGGTFASVANLVSLTVTEDITVDATVYFTIATIVIVLCIFTFILLFRLPITKEKFHNEECEEVKTVRSKGEQTNVFTVLKYIYPTALSVMCVFAVTLSIMPSILSGIRSTNSTAFNKKYFTGFAAFLVFNLGDFTGRIISGFVRIVNKRGPWLPIVCVARIVFIPLFMFCNYQPRHNIPVVFHHDAFPIGFNFLFSVSNGYLASLCMMYGPEMVPADMMETAGATMQLFLTIGLGLGAVMSFLFVDII